MNANKKCRSRKWWMFPPLMIAFILIKAALVMVIWNALIPELFHGPALEYMQALGLLFLVKLFVGFGGRGMGPRGFAHWRHRHWARLTPEERQKLRDEMAKHHHHHHEQ